MNWKVPFLDLRVLDKKEKGDLLGAAQKVFTHGRILLGPEVEQFEKKIAAFCERKYAVGVNSGTDALILGLKSMGIGKGDEVITTSLSWIATANAIAMVGATPVFADIEDDLNISPASVKRLITKKTKAILPVHYTGRICNIEALQEISHAYKLFLIEDAAQSFGAQLKGRPSGSFGTVACFSMNPMKVLGALGEAGVIVTDKKEIYENLISLRYNGTINKEKCVQVSLNGRIDTLQAAFLLVRLKLLKKRLVTRRKNAQYYQKFLQNISGILFFPQESPYELHGYYTYTVRVRQRDDLKKFLEKKGIETKIQHPILMPDQPVYISCLTDNIKKARQAIKEIICLPVHEKLQEQDLRYVVNQIKNFYAD